MHYILCIFENVLFGANEIYSASILSSVRMYNESSKVNNLKHFPTI